MALYHRDVYMPPVAANMRFAVLLRYGQHARDAAITDRYGKLDLPSVLDTREATLIEAELRGNTVIKAVYRMPLNEKLDICLVVHPRDGFVRTVWANLRDDDHRTLDRSKYATE